MCLRASGRRLTALPLALEKIGHQRPLGIGQVGVHAAGAVVAPMSIGVAHAQRRAALNGGTLRRSTQRLEPLDAGFPQRFTHRRPS